MRLVLLALLLLAPHASARPVGEESYRDQAAGLVESMDRSVLRARVATVEHAFGDRDARETAHVMRVEGGKLDLLLAELRGLGLGMPPARVHDRLLLAAETYGDALGGMERCFRFHDDDACTSAFDAIGEAEAHRDAAARVLRVSAFS